MLLYYHAWMFYYHIIATLYHFLGLTYWHSALWQLLFFACFLVRRKSIPNGVQMQRNFTEIFFRPEDTQWAKAARGGAPRRAQGPGAPWWVVLPSEHPQAQPWPIRCLLVQKISSWSFVAFGLRLVLISCDVKNMQKTTTGTWNYVNRLVPKKRYKMTIKWL